MAKKSALGLVTFVKTKLGVPYVYGAKGEVFTRAKYDQLHRMYPSQVTTYELQKIGQVCCDCSGLISWYTGIIRGTENFYDNSFKRLPISQISQAVPGCALYKKGHIGVYIGNGLVIEEMGSKYGCVQKEVKNRNFTHILWLNDIDYSGVNNTTESQPQNTAPTTTVKAGAVTTTTSDLHLCDQPAPTPAVSKSICIMPKGSSVTIVEDTGWGWSKVKYNGKEGYASNAYLALSGLSKKQTCKSTSWTTVNIRSGPSTNTPAVGRITTSNRVFSTNGFALDDKGAIWLNVKYGNVTGFVKFDPGYISVV